MTGGRLSRAAFAAALAGAAALGGCKAKELQEEPPAKGEMPVEQTPVSSLYDQKPGVLYERPARTPSVSPSPVPAPALTPSPRNP